MNEALMNLLIMGADFEKGEAMTATERRHPENAQLREKINHIQSVSDQLQTVAWAREARLISDEELAALMK